MSERSAPPELLSGLTEVLDQSDVDLVRARVVGIVNLLLDDIEKTIVHGSISEKQSFARMFLPQLLRTLTMDEDQTSEALRAKMDEVMAAVRGELPSGN